MMHSAKEAGDAIRKILDAMTKDADPAVFQHSIGPDGVEVTRALYLTERKRLAIIQTDSTMLTLQGVLKALGEETRKVNDMEDKQEICNKLAETLQLTRNQRDLATLTYENRENDCEVVVAEYRNGSKRLINVHMDSGTAMIRDILRALN